MSTGGWCSRIVLAVISRLAVQLFWETALNAFKYITKLVSQKVLFLVHLTYSNIENCNLMLPHQTNKSHIHLFLLSFHKTSHSILNFLQITKLQINPLTALFHQPVSVYTALQHRLTCALLKNRLVVPISICHSPLHPKTNPLRPGLLHGQKIKPLLCKRPWTPFAIGLRTASIMCGVKYRHCWVVSLNTRLIWLYLKLQWLMCLRDWGL